MHSSCQFDYSGGLQILPKIVICVDCKALCTTIYQQVVTNIMCIWRRLLRMSDPVNPDKHLAWFIQCER